MTKPRPIAGLLMMIALLSLIVVVSFAIDKIFENYEASKNAKPANVECVDGVCEIK